MIQTVFLDAQTLGDDISFENIRNVSNVILYPFTDEAQIAERIRNADVVVVNKVKLNAAYLCQAPSLKLICVAATGYDNIDVSYCAAHHIAVTNVVGYSTCSVAQLTIGMALSLLMHMPSFHEYVRNGQYSASGIANRIFPAFHELAGKTWGIVGAGNIGRQVAKIAQALGCRILVYRRSAESEYEAVSLETLCSQADILSIHVPLTPQTNGLISAEMIRKMKPSAIVINVARGSVVDECALANALRDGKLGGLGIDVYSEEPFSENHPYYAIKDYENVCFTPHMAWAAIEARQRCMDEIAENIGAFFRGENRCRVDRI